MGTIVIPAAIDRRDGPGRPPVLIGLVLCLLLQAAAAADLKIATVAPENSQWMRDMRAAAEEVERATAGRVRLRYYTGGVMGSARQVLRRIRTGQLHGGVFTASGMADVYPDIGMYGLPLLFRSEAEVAFVRASVDERLAAGLREKGFVSFGFAGGGFARFMSQRPVRSLEELRGLKIWVPEGNRNVLLAMRELGLTPVRLPVTDVLTGLQTGLLDVVATPAVGAVVLQWHTAVRYVADLPVAYSMAFLAIDRRVFEGLAPADQQAVQAILTATYQAFDERNPKDESSATDALIANGIEYLVPDATESNALRTRMKGLYERLAEQGELERDTFLAVSAELAAFRERGAVASTN